ncbi:MAG: hypothetical protein AAF821_11510 [Cyanobacteria bacterium P01_D01_bin.156]
MRFAISKSLLLLTATMGLTVSFTDTVKASILLPDALSFSSGSELAQFTRFPSQSSFDRDNLDNIRDRLEDRDEDDFDDFRDSLEDRDEGDFDDFRDRLEDRDEDDFDDIRDRLEDRDEDDFDDIRDRVRGSR